MGTCSLTPQHALFHPHRYPCAVSNLHSCPRVLIRSHCLSLSAVTYGCRFLPGPVRGTGVTEMKTCSSCPRGGTLFLPSQSSSSERSGNLLSNCFALATEGPETYLPSVSSGVKHTSGNIRGQDLCQRQGPRLRTQFLWGGVRESFRKSRWSRTWLGGGRGRGGSGGRGAARVQAEAQESSGPVGLSWKMQRGPEMRRERAGGSERHLGTVWPLARRGSSSSRPSASRVCPG